MLRLNRMLWIGAWCVLLVPCEWVHGQLRGGAAADRPGIGGRISARRDDRANRPPPQPAPAIAAAAAAANAARAAQANALRPNAPAAIANAAAAAARANALANTPAARAAVNPAAVNAAAVNATIGDPRISNYGTNPALNPALNPAFNPAYAPALSPVTTASATAAASRGISLPPNRLPYTGPGVLVRLPAELRGEVNYLVDDTEQMVVHSGEEQLLRLKGSYQVRFSRGVTSDGRSYGEGRYTISEGIYRFDVTDNGWELYREADGSELVRRLEEFRQQSLRQQESRLPDASSDLSRSRQASPTLDSDNAATSPGIPAPLAPSSEAELRRPLAPALPSPGKEPSNDPLESPAKEAAAAPAGVEETLPAPRSILEPN